jgi:hypothetical protein
MVSGRFLGDIWTGRQDVVQGGGRGTGILALVRLGLGNNWNLQTMPTFTTRNVQENVPIYLPSSHKILPKFYIQ